MPNTTTDQTCTYHDFAHMLPQPISRARLLALSDKGRFAKYVRPSGSYAEPIFKKADVVEWMHATYSELLPDHVAAFEKHLMKSTKTTRRTPRKRESA